MSQASDGSTASYYELPPGATELQDLISAFDMNAQMGEIGRAWYRYGRCPHSPKLRELKKIIFYAQAEIDRLIKYETPDESVDRGTTLALAERLALFDDNEEIMAGLSEVLHSTRTSWRRYWLAEAISHMEGLYDLAKEAVRVR